MIYGRPDALKTKLRQLKRFEEKLLYGGTAPAGRRLVWDSFFDTRDSYRGNAKYSLAQLAAMSKEEYKAVVDEYFAYMYYELYRKNGMEFPQGLYDPEILRKLGLPGDAGTQDVKRKFRELAKQYHPDTGGDAVRFIELMETYRQLIDK